MQRAFGAVASCGYSNAAALQRLQSELIQFVAGSWRPVAHPTPSCGVCRAFTADAAAPRTKPPEGFDPSVPYELRVSATSKPAGVAGFLLNCMREGRLLKAPAAGKAVYTMVRSVAIANMMLKDETTESIKNKRIAVRPLLQPAKEFKSSYQIDFNLVALDWPADLTGYKDMRIATKSNGLAFRTTLVRSLIDEGIAGVNGAGGMVALRAMINMTETSMRLRELMPQTFDTLIVPGMKSVANEDGTSLTLFHLLIVRALSNGEPVGASAGWSADGLHLHPQALTDKEVQEATPNGIMDRQHFCEYVATTCNFFNNCIQEAQAGTGGSPGETGVTEAVQPAQEAVQPAQAIENK